jgi:hypothetical protein
MLGVEGGFVCIQCEHAAKLAGRWVPRVWTVVAAAAALVLVVALMVTVR